MQACKVAIRLSVIVCAFLISVSAYAGLVQDIGGFLTDPLKLDKSTTNLGQSADRALAALQALEVKSSYDVQSRLEQIRSIIKDLNDGIAKHIQSADALIAKAQSAMNALEQKIDDDAINLIYRAQCAAEVALTDQLQRSLADTIDTIVKANPGVTILGIRVGGVDLKPVTITDPDIAYSSTKSFYLVELGKLKASDPAILIPSKFANVARFARFARCHYIDAPLGMRFLQEEIEFNQLSVPWLSTVVKPTL
jgi:hypothetical protein